MTDKLPTFQAVFGTDWAALPPVLLAHYANRPYSKDVVTVDGLLTIQSSLYMKLLTPLLQLSGALVPYEGEHVPVTVRFMSEPESNAYYFDRTFRFPGRRPYRFRSRMEPIGGNSVVEFMRIGIGWHAGFQWDGKKIVISHRDYAVRLFGRLIPVALELVMGKGYAEEEALDDQRFRMNMHIQHPLLGIIYRYHGTFKVTAVELND